MSLLEYLIQLPPNIAVGVWQNNNEIYKSANSDHHLRIGSITKMFTAIAIKKLFSLGKLNPHDYIKIYLDFDINLNLPSGITIEHLVTMRSGLPDYTTDSTFLAACMVNQKMKWDPQQLVLIALKNPVLFCPGEKFGYSNTNYILLGLILEKITGKNLDEVYQDFIFQPFQMNSTFLPTTCELPDPYFEGFQYEKDNLVNVTGCHPTLAWSSGGIVSTLDDLYKFAQRLIKGYLLSFDRCNKSPDCYGFGFMKWGNFFGHNGSFPGYQSILAVNPQTNSTVIVLINLKQTLDGKSPADEIAHTIFDLLGN